MAARRRDFGPSGPHGPGNRPRRERKVGPLQQAVKQAIEDEIEGLPSAEILMRLRTAGLDTETAKMVYGRVREQVATTRRRAMRALLIAGASLLAIALGLLLAMTTRWPGMSYIWWILVSLLAVIGLVSLVLGQRQLRGLQQPRVEGTRKDLPPGKR